MKVESRLVPRFSVILNMLGLHKLLVDTKWSACLGLNNVMIGCPVGVAIISWFMTKIGTKLD